MLMETQESEGFGWESGNKIPSDLTYPTYGRGKSPGPSSLLKGILAIVLCGGVPGDDDCILGKGERPRKNYSSQTASELKGEKDGIW